MNEAYNKMKYFEETEGIKCKVYYHYTSLDALYSIVQSHTFRLMSLKSSNDRSELHYSPQNFLSDVSKLRDEKPSENFTRDCIAVTQSVSKHSDIFSKASQTQPLPYALCLASKRDNLTHWDRYADTCKGCCIAFNVSSLNVLYKRMNSEALASSYFDIGPAIYSSDKRRQKIKGDIRDNLDFIRQTNITIEDVDSTTLTEIEEELSLLLLVSTYNYIRKFSKDGSFVDEDEIRLYYDGNTYKEKLQTLAKIRSRVSKKQCDVMKKNFIKTVESLDSLNERFTTAKYGIRSYRNMCLDKVWGSGTIPEIILGPQCVQSKYELKRFLKQNGLEGTKVSVSKVPIR